MGAAEINYDGDMSGDDLVAGDSGGMTSHDMGTGTESPVATKDGVGPNYGGMALTAEGAFTSAFGTYLASKYNRRMLGLNAEMARQQAQQALQAGQFAANRLTTRERQIEGQQNAAAAAGGTVVGAGSNRAARASAQSAGAMDRYMIELNARRQALGYNMRAVSDEGQARLEKLQATNSIASTVANAGAMEWLESDPQFGGFRGRGIQFAG